VSKPQHAPFAFLDRAVEGPGVLERALAHLGAPALVRRLFLLGQDAELVEQAAHQRRLTCVDVTDDDEVDAALALLELALDLVDNLAPLDCELRLG